MVGRIIISKGSVLKKKRWWNRNSLEIKFKFHVYSKLRFSQFDFFSFLLSFYFFVFCFCSSLQFFIVVPISSDIFSSWLSFAMISSVGYHTHIRRRIFLVPPLADRKLAGVLSDFLNKVIQLARERNWEGSPDWSNAKAQTFFSEIPIITRSSFSSPCQPQEISWKICHA